MRKPPLWTQQSWAQKAFCLLCQNTVDEHRASDLACPLPSWMRGKAIKGAKLTGRYAMMRAFI